MNRLGEDMRERERHEQIRRGHERERDMNRLGEDMRERHEQIRRGHERERHEQISLLFTSLFLKLPFTPSASIISSSFLPVMCLFPNTYPRDNPTMCGLVHINNSCNASTIESLCARSVAFSLVILNIYVDSLLSMTEI